MCIYVHQITSGLILDTPQDFISITLMNGRALLLCVVGVSGLLDKGEKKEKNFLSSAKTFWNIVNKTQE